MFKHLSLTIILTFLGTIGLFLSGSFLLQHHNANKTLATFLQANDLSFMCWRYALMGLSLIFWSKIIRIIGRWKHWDEEIVSFLIKSRWYLFGFFVLFELLIAHHLLTVLVRWFYQII